MEGSPRIMKKSNSEQNKFFGKSFLKTDVSDPPSSGFKMVNEGNIQDTFFFYPPALLEICRFLTETSIEFCSLR